MTVIAETRVLPETLDATWNGCGRDLLGFRGETADPSTERSVVEDLRFLLGFQWHRWSGGNSMVDSARELPSEPQVFLLREPHEPLRELLLGLMPRAFSISAWRITLPFPACNFAMASALRCAVLSRSPTSLKSATKLASLLLKVPRPCGQSPPHSASAVPGATGRRPCAGQKAACWD